MTDTTRDPALSTDSVVPVTIDPTGGPEGPLAPPEKGEKARSLGSDAWNELRRRPMFWISAALIVFFMLMAALPQLFTSTDPYYADLAKAREAPSADAWFGRDNQGYDVYARTIYGARASILVGLFATMFTLILGSFVGIIAGYRGGWLGLAAQPGRRDLPRYPAAARRHLVPLRLPERSGDALHHRGRQGGPGAGPARLAVDHAPDALQRAPGQAERLRAGRPRARRRPEPDHQLATSCPTRWRR